jgi:hypothetical protein
VKPKRSEGTLSPGNAFIRSNPKTRIGEVLKSAPLALGAKTESALSSKWGTLDIVREA